MIKIVIADDEVVILKGLKKLIAWEELGLQIVGSYKDGNEAFQGIVSLQPDIALLDIHMPCKNGIQLLKEIDEMGIPTKVIFISGYQDFHYAKDALTYGALGYLLKPIVKEELIHTIEKCTSFLLDENRKDSITAKENYEELTFLDEPPYILSLIHVFCQEQEDITSAKIIFFAVFHYLKEYMEKNQLGIVFEKNKKIVLIFKGKSISAVKESLFEALDNMKSATGHRAGAIIGNSEMQLGEIESCYRECLGKLGYFYFLDTEKPLLISQDKIVYSKEIQADEYMECKEQLVNIILSLHMEQYEKQLTWFGKIIAIKADGKKDDAFFYACDVIQALEMSLDSLGTHDFHPEVKEILSTFRETKSFSEMMERLDSYLRAGIRQVQILAANQEQTYIQTAKEYIQNHYQENITLEIIAEQVHMNSFYFSKYFKKHAGINYKDYLDGIRLKQAKKLLVTTDMSSKDISVKAGFTDVRTFTKLLKKEVGETPVQYRNRMKKQYTGV